MNKADYKFVNSEAYLNSIEVIGRGKRRFHQTIKRRFDAGGAREDGDLGIGPNGELWVAYESLSHWQSRQAGEQWGYVWFVMLQGGQRTSRRIHTLYRNDDNLGFVIDRVWSIVESVYGHLPEDGELCAIWIGGTDDGSNRRTDLGPIRYKADDTPPPPPPPKPIANFNWTPSDPGVDTPVDFDGSSSSGEQLKYAWYINSVYEGNTVLFRYTFSTGTHEVKLQVTDMHNVTSETAVDFDFVDPPEPPMDPLPDEWGLIAVADQAWKGNVIRAHLPDLKWLRSELNFSYLVDLGFSTPRAAAAQAVDVWYDVARAQGFNIMVGVYGSTRDLTHNNPAHWQEFVLRVGEGLANKGELVWFTADVEMNPKFIENEAQYYDLWVGEPNLIDELQKMGHKVCGPGAVFGNVDYLRRALNEIPFDAPSAHFYAGAGANNRDAMLKWIKDATDIAKAAGYSWGVVGETGAAGDPHTALERYCPFDGHAAQIRRTRELFADLDTDAARFWRMKFWYQVLDRPDQGKYPGFGLFTVTKKEDGVIYVPKPVLSVWESLT